MQQTIGIFTIKVAGLPPWDPDSIRSGISGSEESVIYSSQALAKLGFKVFVFNEPPEGSYHSLPDSNPRFTNYFPDRIVFDIIIACRIPEFVECLKHRAKKIYFWPQDTCYYKVKEENILAFDDVFWISSWQRKQWISINPLFSKFTHIFGNAVQQEQFKEIKPRENPHSCIYASNYARGLSVLLDVWPHIKSKFPKAILDIYYGWQHWGTMSELQERNLRSQIADLQRLDVKDHGLVGHEELSKAFSKSSFWTYPCIHDETFCITAIKAQLSGAIPVIIEGSALREVVRYGFKCSEKEQYKELLSYAMSQEDLTTLQDRKNMGNFILDEFTWTKMVLRWKELFL